MKAKLYTSVGKENGEIELPEEVFGVEVNEHLMHLVVKGYLANQRQGTAKSKTRAQVSGGGAKPFRQKGTGRARSGSNTSPLYRRGGKHFGSVPRSYVSTIPRKMRRRALCSALSSRARDEKVLVIEKFAVDAPKTKTVAGLLKAMAADNVKSLLVVGPEDRAIYLSGRNIRNLQVKPLADIHTYDVLSNENIIFTDKDLVEKTKEVVSL